jgi:NADH dehydrogenase
VKHFVFVSAYVADPESLVPFLAAKGKTEAYLRHSGLAYTILAPNAFMESWVEMLVGTPALSGQPVTLVGGGERIHSFISITDAASFAIAAVSNPAALNRRLVLGGPEALSFRDAAEVYEKVLGRSVPVCCVAPGEPLPGLPEYIWAMAASFDTYDSPMDMTSTAGTFGVELTPLETFVRQNSEFHECFSNNRFCDPRCREAFRTG